MTVQEERVTERFNFAELPDDCTLRSVGIDWNGEPLLLCEEGRPLPSRSASTDAHIAYRKATPRAHHIVHWRNGAASSFRIQNDGYKFTSHIQPFRDGWLLADGRGGIARVLGSSGQLVTTLDLGDASEDVQTTPDGQIWVGYFDEGVFGTGIGQAGAVCFDAEGKPIFSFNQFAKRKQLPFIADCYTMNVTDNAAWLCYYTDFPLVRIEGLELAGVWKEFGGTKAIAVRGDAVIRFPAYDDPFLYRRTLDSKEQTQIKLIAPSGEVLSQLEPPGQQPQYVPFQVRARGGRIYVFDDKRLYEMP